jgi:hypothetical protein
MKLPKHTPPPRNPIQQNARRLDPPGVVQRKVVAPWITDTPVAPRRYSPQPVPKVLQTKRVGPVTPPAPRRVNIARGGGTVQRMISNPFDMPDPFAGLRGNLIPPPVPILPPPMPLPLIVIGPPPTPVASPLVPVSSPVSVPKSVPLSPKPLEQKKKQKAKPMSLDAFIGAKDDTGLFASLPSAGALDSRAITFSQFRCGARFQTGFKLDGRLISSVSDLESLLSEKPELYVTTPPIKITLYKKRLMSVDNRRLKAHRSAGAKICFIKVEYKNLTFNDRSHIDDEAPAENCNVT